MNKAIIIGIFLYLFVFVHGYAQLSEGGKPYGYALLKNSKCTITLKTMPAFSVEKMLEEDKEFPEPLRYARLFYVDYNIKEEGTCYQVNEEDTIWLFQIASSDAYSIGLFFKEYYIPEGARLFIYNTSKTLCYGAFTHKNNKEYKSFAIADFPGDHVIIEYYEPHNARFKGKLVLGSVGHAYRDVFNIKNGDAVLSDLTHIDINCFEGNGWELEKHAVCRMFCSGYLCTGALINTTQNDGTPYFLTANHCINDESAAKELITFFNYETLDCGSREYSYKTLSGAHLMATDTLSDFTLLLLAETPDTSYKPYYAGWNREDIAPRTSTCIHHPSGNVKEISIEFDSAVSYGGTLTWNDGTTSLPHSHWIVQFDMGLTEGGSSGSPLFNQDKHIVGQLHGGSNRDLYGKLSVSWDTNPAENRQLKAYLDSVNSGVMFVDGYHPDMRPDPDFTCSIQHACLNAPVRFTDLSVFKPTSWLWSFDPDTVTFEGGTNANSQNPVVSFKNSGNYTVTLKSSNAHGSSTKSRADYITAGNQIMVLYIPANLQEMCGYELENTRIMAFGADTYEWSIDTTGIGNIVTIDNPLMDTAYLHYASGYQSGESFVLPVKIVGVHGACKDSVEINIAVVRQPNDDISAAIPLQYGVNGAFTNECATVQMNEPIPPQGDCNTQYTWCVEGGVQNSIWFTFEGPDSGAVTINTPGFDNQLAAYDADSYNDVLNGNYVLLAANDDYNPEDYSARITDLANLTSGKTYWLQVDGSAGGVEGVFTINLSNTQVGIDDQERDDGYPALTIFPNPCKEFIRVQMLTEDKNQQITIALYNQVGQKVYLKKYPGTDEVFNEKIMVYTLSEGMYYLQASYGSKVYGMILIKN